ncbi:MAG: MoaD/ThiS family protein [Deltaproteobacteria bacterium]|nr:MoaD/ThiS family protein [Deltaproteobacteria bacterium]
MAQPNQEENFMEEGNVAIINVKFMGDLRALLQQRAITLALPPGSTVGDLFASLCNSYGEPFTSRVFSGSGALQHYILVFLDGQNIKELGGLGARLGNGEVEIVMLPMFEGG